MKRDLAYFYMICNQPDDVFFVKQCAAIEKKFRDMQKFPLLEDVDGSAFQSYRHKKGEIRVSNDYGFGSLYVEADFDLLPYFDQPSD